MTTTAPPVNVAPQGDLPPDSDEAVGRRLAAGDRDAIATLFERYGQPIHDYIARCVGDPAAAEDLAQQTFLRALERSSTLRKPSSVRSWLYQIAYHLTLNHLQRCPATVDVDAVAGLASQAADPEIEVLGRSAADLVWTAAASLEERQLAVLQLSVRHQLSAAEVGEVIGVPAGHASVLVHRAGEALGKALRSLVLARSRNHCAGLAALVPAGVKSLTADQHRSVDHHLRRCALCRVAAERLTSPAELFGTIALLPLPAQLAKDALLNHAGAGAPAAASTAAHVTGPALRAGRLRSLLTTPAVLAGIAGVALLGTAGGAYGAFHRGGSVAPITSPGASSPAGLPPSQGTLTTPTTVDEATKSASQVLADTLADVRRSSSYHLRYAASSAQPRTGDLDMRFTRNGDFAGQLVVGLAPPQTFDVIGVGGRVFVSGSSVAQAPNLFGLSDAQAQSLGSSWLELSNSGSQGSQYAFLGIVQQTVTRFATPDQLAAGILSDAGAPATEIVTMADGQQVIRLASSNWTMDVSDSSTPYPIHVTAITGDLALDGFDGQRPVVVPTSSRTLPGI